MEQTKHMILNIGANYTDGLEEQYPDVVFQTCPYEVKEVVTTNTYGGVLIKEDGSMIPAVIFSKLVGDDLEYQLGYDGHLVTLNVESYLFGNISDKSRINDARLTLEDVDGNKYSVSITVSRRDSPVHQVECYFGENGRIVVLKSGSRDSVGVAVSPELIDDMDDEDQNKMIKVVAEKCNQVMKPYRTVDRAYMHPEPWISMLDATILKAVNEYIENNV